MLDTLRSSVRLRAVVNTMSRLVAVETVTGFLIRVVVGITQVYRVALNSFLNNGSEDQGHLGALRLLEFSCRGMYLRRDR
jgi:hypothetical protein